MNLQKLSFNPRYPKTKVKAFYPWNLFNTTNPNQDFFTDSSSVWFFFSFHNKLRNMERIFELISWVITFIPPKDFIHHDCKRISIFCFFLCFMNCSWLSRKSKPLALQFLYDLDVCQNHFTFRGLPKSLNVALKSTPSSTITKGFSGLISLCKIPLSWR